MSTIYLFVSSQTTDKKKMTKKMSLYVCYPFVCQGTAYISIRPHTRIRQRTSVYVCQQAGKRQRL